MTRHLLVILAIAWAVLLSGFCRADAARAISRLCPPGRTYLAPFVDSAARLYLLHPALLTALIAHESRCDPWAESGRGDYGLGQIRVGGSAAMGASAFELFYAALNLGLTARYLSRWIAKCRSVHGGLSVYSGRSRCRQSAYSRSVLAKFHSAFERRS
jgi:soluble lytic murein transglycosylase-like protein